MRQRRVHRVAFGVLVASLLVLVAGLVSGAAAGSGAVAAAAGSTTFTDPAGDQQTGAPDITSIALSDDPATGVVKVALTATGVAGTSSLIVYLDTDRNVSTGYEGFEYAVVFAQASDDWDWDMLGWNGSAWLPVPQSPALSFSRSGDLLTWSVGKADIGGTTGFAFLAVGLAFGADGAVTGGDRAPDGGDWVYDLSQPPPATTRPTTTAPPKAVTLPVIGKPTTLPVKATAGKHLTVSFPVTRSDDRAPLTTGTMICDPSVDGKVIAHSEHFTSGIALLSFTVPAKAKGEQLKVKVTIKLGSHSTTRVSTFRVG